jgi:HK97 family phage prohead protease
MTIETLEGATFHISAPGPVTFEVDRQARTIRGVALPFGDVGTSSTGDKFKFSRGSIRWGKPKLLNAHDWHQLSGTAEFEDTDDALMVVARVAKTARGDEQLALAEAGALDSFSVGFANGMKAKRVGDVFEVSDSEALEVSTTPLPGFERAAITGVTASKIPNTKEDAMSGAAPTTDPAPAPAPNTPPAPTPGIPATNETPTRAEFAALAARIEKMGETPHPLTAVTSVKEEPIYRFGGSIPAPSGHDFANDLYQAGLRGDAAALARLTTFTAERLGTAFVASSDVDEVNPNVYRPDMFLGQRPTNPAPLHSFFYKGSISSPQPFFYSKLDRGATTAAIGDHTEGNEPAATTLVTATGATVTPAAVSGKVHITREVGDLGGNPQVSGLVWSEFERTYSEDLEAKTAAFLAAASGTAGTLATPAAGADGAAVGLAMETGSVDLLFTGYNWSAGFGHVDLFKALVGARTTADEPIYPIINPANRNGISGSKFAFIDIAGYRWYPAAALGVTGTVEADSWLADPMAVHVWNSGLLRLDKLQEDVEGWDLGAFGYHAGVLYDTDRLRKLPYDPAA